MAAKYQHQFQQQFESAILQLKNVQQKVAAFADQTSIRCFQK